MPWEVSVVTVASAATNAAVSFRIGGEAAAWQRGCGCGREPIRGEGEIIKVGGGGGDAKQSDRELASHLVGRQFLGQQ